MNIYTVKWGDKYNHQHVNNVYKACKEFYNEDFDFFCLTEKKVEGAQGAQGAQGLLKTVSAFG